MRVNTTVSLSKSVKQMLEKLRSNHIDAMLYIQEELSQILPPLIEDIVKTLYDKVIE